MTLHSSTFEYHQPTLEQVAAMGAARAAAKEYARVLETLVPGGPDKTYILRSLRTVAMWVNVAITRETDGLPRQEAIGSAVKNYPVDHPVEGDLGSIPL